MPVAHWPNVLDDPNASDAERNIAQRCADGIPIIVISDSLTVDETGPWRKQTTIIRRSDTATELAEIRESDETAVIFGSQARSPVRKAVRHRDRCCPRWDP